MSLYWMIGFPVALLAVAVGGALVALAGTDKVLGSTGTPEIPKAIEDPNAPGWTAVVEPTETAMVAHTGSEGALTGVSVLIGDEDEAEGGSVLVIPADTQVTAPGLTDPILLSALFEDQGVDGLAVGVGGLLGFGFTEGESVLDADAFEQLLNAVAPIEITVVDPITTVDPSDSIVSGTHQFDASELVSYFEVLGDGESPLNRTDRQRRLWVALLVELANDEAAVDSVVGSSEPFGELLGELAAGPVNDLSLPVTPEFSDGEERPIYLIRADDADQIASMSAAIVPLPTAPYPGARARLELSDGAGDATARDTAIPALTTAGAELVLLRNELVFDQERSEVIYYDESFAQIAADMADAIGAAEPTLVASEGPLFDVEVTLGRDWEP